MTPPNFREAGGTKTSNHSATEPQKSGAGKAVTLTEPAQSCSEVSLLLRACQDKKKGRPWAHMFPPFFNQTDTGNLKNMRPGPRICVAQITYMAKVQGSTAFCESDTYVMPKAQTPMSPPLQHAIFFCSAWNQSSLLRRPKNSTGWHKALCTVVFICTQPGLAPSAASNHRGVDEQRSQAISFAGLGT